MNALRIIPEGEDRATGNGLKSISGQDQMVFHHYTRSAHIGRLELWDRDGERAPGSRAPNFLMCWRRWDFHAMARDYAKESQ